MKILIDVEELQQRGVLTPALALQLKQHAVSDTGSTAINLLLAFGAVVVVAGAMSLMPTPTVALFFGIAFIGAGYFVTQKYAAQWGKLGSIWMIIGALLTAGALAALIGYSTQGDVTVERPFAAALVVTAVLTGAAMLAESRLLIALVPLAISGAIGGSTGYWHATYMISIREATITIILFTLLGLGGWFLARNLRSAQHDLAITFTRMCVILVNMGFWIGSLWGDRPGELWRVADENAITDTLSNPQIPDTTFIVAWALALLAAGAWGAKNGRRFLVNTVAVFGAIHFYTQWFEHLGADPLSVMIAGVATIGIGLTLWKYNKRELEAKV